MTCVAGWMGFRERVLTRSSMLWLHALTVLQREALQGTCKGLKRPSASYTATRLWECTGKTTVESLGLQHSRKRQLRLPAIVS